MDEPIPQPPPSDDGMRKPIGDMTPKELLEEAARQQAERDRENRQQQGSDIEQQKEEREPKQGDLTLAEYTGKLPFFREDTDEEIDEWVKRGGNFGPGYGVGSKQQHIGQNKKGDSIQQRGSTKQQHTGGEKEEESEKSPKNKYDKRSNNGSDIELDNKQIKSIVELVEPYYKEGVRYFIILSLSGFLYKIGVSKGSALELIDFLTHSDRKAVTIAEANYDKDSSEVVGYTRLLETLTQFEDTKKAQEIIGEIKDIVNKKRQRNKFSHIASLAGKIVAEISHDPLKLVVCDPLAKNVSYVSVTEIEIKNQKIQVVSFGRIALNTSLVEVSIYQNPLEFLRQPDKYCIKFDSYQRGCFVLEGSIDSILKQLDEIGLWLG